MIIKTRLVLVMLIMPLMGFSCAHGNNYIVRPGLEIDSKQALSEEDSSKYFETLGVFARWATENGLNKGECSEEFSSTYYSAPCISYMYRYESCGFFGCGNRYLQISMLLDPDLNKIRVEFYEFGYSNITDEEEKMLDGLRSSFEKSIGKESFIEYKESFLPIAASLPKRPIQSKPSFP